MLNFVDIAVLVIIALFVIVGFFRGFLGSMISLLGTLLALGAAFFLARTVANLIGGIGGLKDALGGVFAGLFSGDIFNLTVDVTSVESVSAVLFSLGLPEFLSTIIAPAIVNSAPPGMGEVSLAGYLGPMLVNIALLIISFILIFLIVRFIMKLIEKFVKGLLMNKTLRTGDRILGGVFGLAKGYIVLCILLLLFGILIPAVPALESAQIMIEESTLTKTISDNNILQKLIESLNIPELLQGLFGG